MIHTQQRITHRHITIDNVTVITDDAGRLPASVPIANQVLLVVSADLPNTWRFLVLVDAPYNEWIQSKHQLRPWLERLMQENTHGYQDS